MKIAIFISGTGTNFNNMLQKSQTLPNTTIACLVSSLHTAPGLNIAKEHNIPHLIPTPSIHKIKAKEAQVYNQFLRERPGVLHNIEHAIQKKIKNITSNHTLQWTNGDTKNLMLQISQSLKGTAGGTRLQNFQQILESRIKYECEILSFILPHNISYIFLAGFMIILSPFFINYLHAKLQAPDRIINIHPSLLPNFPGANAVRQAILAKATTTGCTAHYVNTEIDGGSIIDQQSVAITPDDDVASLTQKIKNAESKLYPKVLEKLVTNPSTLPHTNTAPTQL